MNPDNCMNYPIILSARLLLLALPLAGCATAPSAWPPASASELHQAPVAAPLLTPEAAKPPAPQGKGVAEGERIPPVLVKGSDVMIGKASARGGVSLQGEGVALRFEQAPITDVVHAVLGDLLKLDYAIVTPLAGEITVHTQAPVARAQVLAILESLLQANGIVMVPDAAGRYRIGSSEALKGAVPLPRRTEALPSGFGSVVVPLQYIGVVEMAEILRPVASDQALLRVDTVRNLLILAGTRAQIDGWLEIINTFDVDFLKGMSVGLFPLTYSSVKDVDSALRTLLGGGSGAGANAGPAQGAGSAGSSAPGTTAIGGARTSGADSGPVQIASPLAGLIRVLPIERLNALLVVTPRAHYLEQARVWIERFDRPSDSDTDPQLYVYPVQNGSATHLANLLNGLYGVQATAGQGGGSTGVAPGQQSATQTSNALSNVGFSGGSAVSGGMSLGLTGVGASAQGRGTAQGGAANAVTQVSLGPDIRVVADGANNALLIHASRREYRRIEAALRQLDVAPTQVLIEASILEVTLNDELKYGLQWYFQDKARRGLDGVGQLTSGTSNAISTSNPGFSYSLVSSAGQIRAVLTALATKELLNVISTPTVMVQDNYTASIQVGDQQPVQGSTTITDGGTTTNSIQYKDTGVALAVTPSVNAGDMVSMVVNQTITDVGPIDEATKQRSFLQRQVSSRVAVRSGESVVLGGLIRDNKKRNKQGIPFLHDLPVVGNLFGTTTIDTDRTELLVMITPRVVRTEQDVRTVGAELRERMRRLDDLKGAGVPGWSRSPDGGDRAVDTAVPPNPAPQGQAE